MKFQCFQTYRSTLYACPIGSFFDTEKGQCWPHGDGFVCPGTETTTEEITTTTEAATTTL